MVYNLETIADLRKLFRLPPETPVHVRFDDDAIVAVPMTDDDHEAGELQTVDHVVFMSESDAEVAGFLEDDLDDVDKDDPDEDDAPEDRLDEPAYSWDR